LEDRLRGSITVDMALLSLAGTDRLWVGRPRKHGSFTAGTKGFSILRKRPDQLRYLTSTLFDGYRWRGRSQGAKRPERQVNHSLPSSAEAKKVWIYNPISHMSHETNIRTSQLSVLICYTMSTSI